MPPMDTRSFLAPHSPFGSKGERSFSKNESTKKRLPRVAPSEKQPMRQRSSFQMGICPPLLISSSVCCLENPGFGFTTRPSAVSPPARASPRQNRKTEILARRCLSTVTVPTLAPAPYARPCIPPPPPHSCTSDSSPDFRKVLGAQELRSIRQRKSEPLRLSPARHP